MRFDTVNSNHITLLVLLLSIIGLISIYFAVNNITPIELKIESIEESMNGRMVKINGRIDDIRESKSGNFYWTVSDGSNITVPILDDKFKKIDVKSGDDVEVTGLVSEYNGELEVMPKEIYVK